MRISDWSSDVCSSDLLTFDDGSSTRLDCTYPVDGDSWRAIAIGKLTAFAGDRIDVERVVAIVETLEHEETVEPLIAALGADFDSLHRQPTTASPTTTTVRCRTPGCCGAAGSAAGPIRAAFPPPC